LIVIRSVRLGESSIRRSAGCGAMATAEKATARPAESDRLAMREAVATRTLPPRLPARGVHELRASREPAPSAAEPTPTAQPQARSRPPEFVATPMSVAKRQFLALGWSAFWRKQNTLTCRLNLRILAR